MKLIVKKSEFKKVNELVSKQVGTINAALDLNINVYQITEEDLNEMGVLDENDYMKVEATETEVILTISDEGFDVATMLIDTAMDMTLEVVSKHKIKLGILSGLLKNYIFKTVIPDITAMIDESLIVSAKELLTNIKTKFKEVSEKIAA